MVDMQKSLYVLQIEEMLKGPMAGIAKSIARDQLERWKQRISDGQELPSHVRQEVKDLAILLFEHEGRNHTKITVKIQDDINSIHKD